MLKVISSIEFTVNNKLFKFQCDPDSSLPDAKEALFLCQAFLAKIEEQEKARQAQVEAENAAKQTAQPVSEEVPQEVSDKVEALPQG